MSVWNIMKAENGERHQYVTRRSRTLWRKHVTYSLLPCSTHFLPLPLGKGIEEALSQRAMGRC